MIVPMKKITLFISAGSQTAALEQLRSLGIVHVKPIRTPAADDLTTLEARLNRTEKALACLNLAAHASPERMDSQITAETVVDQIIALTGEMQQLHNSREEIGQIRDWFDKWGRVARQDIALLRQHGIFLKLYTASPGWLTLQTDNDRLQLLAADKIQLRLAYFGQSESDQLDLKEEIIPSNDYATTIATLDQINQQLAGLQSRLDEMNRHMPALLAYRDQLRRQHEFATVRSGMGSAGEIVYLEGFCPAGQVAALMQTAETEGWGVLSADPEPTDNPPTLLQMKKWVSLIRPVFDFLGTIPGYREYDISQYFLVFFTVFVAMIIGDAGYGAIFLLLCLLAHRKARRLRQPLALGIKLFYLLSIGTILWGTISGNWFGSAWIAARGVFKTLTIPQIATFPEVFPDVRIDPQKKVMQLCFIIAVLQLGLASLMNFFNQFPQSKSYGHLGWFSLTVGLFFLVLKLVLGYALPGFAVPMIYGGLAAVIIFSNQEPGQHFLKGLARGLGGAFNTFLSSISSFSNIISYIRLFAVGMASVAIASSFNQMAAPMLGKAFLVPVALVILLIGHGLNIVMGLLSVIVHGIRLNMLEFSGQLGIEWAGYKYEPFKDHKPEISKE